MKTLAMTLIVALSVSALGAGPSLAQSTTKTIAVDDGAKILRGAQRQSIIRNFTTVTKPEELKCTATGGGHHKCISDVAFVCPAGWSACSGAPAGGTCCSK